MNDENMIQQEHVVSLGEKLSSLRKKMGLSVDDIAERIHVRKTVIFDLENDIPIKAPTVFLKGYIRAYANIVGLDASEYRPYFDSLTDQQQSLAMKNYSHKEQNKRHGKRIFLISFVILLLVVGTTLFFVWKDSKSDLVEVSHYISPTPTSINS